MLIFIFWHSPCVAVNLVLSMHLAFENVVRVPRILPFGSHLSGAAIERGHTWRPRGETRRESRERKREFTGQVERPSRSINSTQRSQRSRSLDWERKRGCFIESDYISARETIEIREKPSRWDSAITRIFHMRFSLSLSIFFSVSVSFLCRLSEYSLRELEWLYRRAICPDSARTTGRSYSKFSDRANERERSDGIKEEGIIRTRARTHTRTHEC